VKTRILVVDDEESVRQVVSFTLEQAGYEVESSADGDDCLEKVYSFRPDLILLDLMMPLVDGWEVLRLLRSNPETADIPVVILTAKGEIYDKMFALQQGAADYITKPFGKRELLERISAIVK
jgi:two-component system alkaline phosphatase synthesis response regulator PhoP